MRNLLLTNILNKQKPKMDSGEPFIIYNNNKNNPSKIPETVKNFY